MKRRLMVLCFSLMLFATALIPASSAEDFQVMWAMEVPRATYFIGETVSFTVTAFASTDPSLKLPGEMALVTIRNESLVEVYSAWITTNANGSAPVNYEIDLTADTGNYTIILDAIQGENVHESFMVLFNEETYWKERVDDLEKQIERIYQHMNYLFAFDRFLERKVAQLERQVKIFGILAFVTVMCALYVGMRELAMSKRTTSGFMSIPSKAAELLFRSKPIVELDHEIIQDVQIPREKRVPIYGHTFFCPICDPNKVHSMTENQLRDHLWAKHDRLHLKKDSIMAKYRDKKKESRKKAIQKEKEPIEPAFASVEKYQEEWKEHQTKEHFKSRLKNIKRQIRNRELTQEEAKVGISQLKADLLKVGLPEVVLKQTTSPKPVSYRKVRMETPISGILEKTSQRAPEIPNSKSAIDNLFEKLSNEKVN